MRLSEIGEFGLIERIRGKFAVKGAEVLAAIGDDCAAIRMPSGDATLLVTTDMLVEEVHFRRDLIKWRQLGFKSMAVNLSDVAAMGGRPKWAFISMALTDDMAVEDIDDFYEGAMVLGAKHGVDILGGDTSRSPRGAVISISIIGFAEDGLFVKRSGASPGESLYVAGTLGDSAAGLDILRGRLKADGLQGERVAAGEKSRSKLIEKHLCPEPRLDEGNLLARLGLATSMIDISDGLSSDIAHICRESGVGCEVRLEWVPLSEELKFMSPYLPKRALEYGVSGGEDYELLFTVKKENAEKLKEAWRRLKTPLSEIGVIKDASFGLRLASEAGWTSVLKPTGHDHFAKVEAFDSS